MMITGRTVPVLRNRLFSSGKGRLLHHASENISGMGEDRGR